MFISNSLKNIRCDTANCNKFSSFVINTSGYKGSLCLCEDCFDDLLNQMKKFKAKNKEQRNEKAKH